MEAQIPCVCCLFSGGPEGLGLHSIHIPGHTAGQVERRGAPARQGAEGAGNILLSVPSVLQGPTHGDTSTALHLPAKILGSSQTRLTDTSSGGLQ